MTEANATAAERLLDPRAEAVLLAHWERFLGFLTRRTGDRSQAEEILQAAFVKALERGAPGADDEGVVAWFHRVLSNAFLDHVRRRAAEGRALAREEQEAEGGAHEPELRDAVCACVRDLVPALRPGYAELIEAVDLAGRPVVEAAREAGITAGNAGVRLHRARRALREALARACGACAAHGCLDCACGGARPRLV